MIKLLFTFPLAPVMWAYKYIAAIIKKDPSIRESFKKTCRNLFRLKLTQICILYIAILFGGIIATAPYAYQKQWQSNSTYYTPLKIAYLEGSGD